MLTNHGCGGIVQIEMVNNNERKEKDMNETIIEKPWQGSGIEVVGSSSAEEVMSKSFLNWEVEGRPLYYSNISAEDITNLVQDTTQKAIVRKSDNVKLGNVGINWNILQNYEIFQFVDELVKIGLLKYMAAGQFKGGRIVYVLAEFAESEILPGDIHKQYLLFTNAYDGTFSVRIGWTDIRVICWNTFQMASAEVKKSGFSIRHTAAMRDKIEEAKQALIAMESEARKAEMFQKALTRVQMTGDMWKEFGEVLIPNPADGKNKTRAENSRGKLLSLALTGRGQDIPGVAGTAYSAFNGLTEYVNYERSSRGKDNLDRQSSRFQSTLFGSGQMLIDRGIGILNGFLVDHNIQVDSVV